MRAVCGGVQGWRAGVMCKGGVGWRLLCVGWEGYGGGVMADGRGISGVCGVWIEV